MTTHDRSRHAIIFDLDGTLIDSLPGICDAINATVAELGFRASTDQLKTLIGPPIRAILKQLAPNVPESRLDLMERSFRLAYDTKSWRLTTCQPGVAETLPLLTQTGFRLFVATNKPKEITNIILRHLKIVAHFSAVINRDSRVPGFLSKDKMLEALFETYGLHCGETWMIGDTLEDYRAACSVGIPCALFTGGYGWLTESDWPANCHRLDQFDNLPNLLKKGMLYA